ncbi:hypothetical protein FIBSPDRAFT_872050 [Athelia psychrophila]|uniref:RlpA-like protein double-psi beta-barrel domain-containing protein n=1 Tax=Athelia psychrophila TaxID=1759441 RepID=A0A165ZTG9_9AGAM|nr:hypothetical protein FIBSPDRAFT_872050 [Fibularhizoctonia sp. CBS 109695]
MFFSCRTVALVLAATTTLVEAQSEVGDAHHSINGLGTFFETGLGACGVYNVDTDYIVAISEALFDSYTETSPGNPNTNVLCNRPISISYGGVNVQATITDRCAGCAGWGDLAMTPSLFTRFAAESVGRIYSVDWVRIIYLLFYYVCGVWVNVFAILVGNHLSFRRESWPSTSHIGSDYCFDKVYCPTSPYGYLATLSVLPKFPTAREEYPITASWRLQHRRGV